MLSSKHRHNKNNNDSMLSRNEGNGALKGDIPSPEELHMITCALDPKQSHTTLF